MSDVDFLIENLITEFKAQQWTSKPMEKALRLATSNPEDIVRLAQEVMKELPQGGTFLDAALSFLPNADWPGLVHMAIKHLRTNSHNRAAEKVIRYASLQCIQSVHPFLLELFFFGERFDTSSWRESGTLHLEFLTHYVSFKSAKRPSEAGLSREEYRALRFRAFSALLETRHPDALSTACAAAFSLNIAAEPLRSALQEVDFEQEGEGFRSLVPATVRHLQFPEGYIKLVGYSANWTFPSWETLAPDAYRYAFGGTLDTNCGLCHQPLHHLLTLDPLLDGLGVSSVPKLTLATCMSCLGYEADWLFFQHDERGVPSAHNPDPTCHYPEVPLPPLQETQVAISVPLARWRWQDWGASNARENLHRIGGHPTWVQQAIFPACPACDRTMPFLMQFDSELPLTDGRSLLWGSGGIAYFFWCDSCRISATTSQWT
jgi:hypothetical protein